MQEFLSAEEIIELLKTEYGYTDSEIEYCSGIMGVPVTFLDKYCPEQFEIIGQGQGNLYRQLSKTGLSQKFVDDYYRSGQTGNIKENHPVLGYYDCNAKPIIPYMRILIRRKPITRERSESNNEN